MNGVVTNDKWRGVVDTFQLTQVITSPTRVTATTDTLIDHIYTTHPQHVRASKVGVLPASDHLPVVMLRKRSSTKAAVPCAITYRQYKHFDAYHFVHGLHQMPWSDIAKHTDVLKTAAPAITVSVTTFVNKSIVSGQFPTLWTLAKITPIHRKGPTENKSKLSTDISLVCSQQDIGETCIDSLYTYLMFHNMLHDGQSGFRAKHSCETALNHMVHKWALAIDKGLVNGVVLLDLHKGSDLVNHTILLVKLAIYGCSQQSVRWFSSYLLQRKQFVLFKGKQSEQSEIITGVPQGSILGPLFFIVFMNDMPMTTRTITNVDMYADDSTISACGKNVEEIEIKLNNDLEEISNWCDENRMVVNVEETKIMIVTTRQKWQHLDQPDEGDKLQVIENERLLGLHVDNFLTWKAHIQNIHITIAGKLTLLCGIKQYLPYKAREMFYNSYILPHMDYCSTFWGNATTSDRIYKLQRTIIYSEYRAPSGPLLEQLNWLPLPERVKYRQSQLVYKAMNGLAPDYMCALFTPISNISTRKSGLVCP